jgi:hypothetical protein
VRVIGLNKYLEMIGYQTPRALEDTDKGGSLYRGTAEPKADAPKADAPKADAPKKDDKADK